MGDSREAAQGEAAPWTERSDASGPDFRKSRPPPRRAHNTWPQATVY